MRRRPWRVQVWRAQGWRAQGWRDSLSRGDLWRGAGLLAGAALTLGFLLWPGAFVPLLAPFAPEGGPVIYPRAALLGLALDHLALVAAAIVPAMLVSVAAAAFVSRPAGADFLPAARVLVNFGQAMPPVAILALTIPVFGFGRGPTLAALFLYALLPMFEGALVGLRNVPAPVRLSARAMGLSAWQVLWQVELPLAAPVILEGVRIATVISLSTAAIGSTVAASSLGEVIIAGLNVNNQAFILQGGLLTAALAMLTHAALGLLADRLRRHQRPS